MPIGPLYLGRERVLCLIPLSIFFIISNPKRVQIGAIIWSLA